MKRSASDLDRVCCISIDTPLGPMRAAASEVALCELVFSDEAPRATGSNAVLDQLRAELSEYFVGARREFTIPLAPRGTQFQQRVWGALQRIPFGDTASYSDIASVLGSPAATRAVGQANGANRIYLLVPCHRVIAKDGSLGGYGAGASRKRALLELERSGRLPT